MLINKIKKGQIIRIYNPSNMFGSVYRSVGNTCTLYSDVWVRGYVDEIGLVIDNTTDKKNYIVVELIGEINHLTHTDDYVEDNPTVYRLKVISGNSYIARHLCYPCARPITDGMILYAYPNIQVEMDDPNEKEKEKFIFNMFPILSQKYPELKDFEVLKKAKTLANDMYK